MAIFRSMGDRIIERLNRRGWPILASVIYVGLGLAYFFLWGSVVRHTPHLWITPGDLWTTYQASGEAAHGHFSAIYGSGFLAFPGFLLVLAPLGAFTNVFNTTFFELKNHGHLTGGLHYVVPGTNFSFPDFATSGGNLYDIHRQAFVVLGPLILIVSCVVLFALDAMAERLQVSRSRRAVLSIAEAVLLWNVTVIWGHPEDAVAVALVVYALIFAIDRRFTGAGWLFGAAFAVQPLVIVVFPLLLVLGGKSRALGLVVRGIVPAAAVIIAPLASDARETVHALVTQPTFPNVSGNHRTPWTFLAPKVGGHGVNAKVGGGPLRTISLALAAGLGWWAIRWRERPEMIVWAAALALALRTYTEPVMTDYYVWPALAVGLVVAARGSARRFGIAITIAIATTVLAQWNLRVDPWWAVQVIGVTGLLVAAAKPELTESNAEPVRARAATVPARRGASNSKKKKGRSKAGRADRKRSARR